MTALSLPSDIRIETERLTLRLVVEADLPALLEVNGDDQTTRYLPYESWRGMDDAQVWFARALARHATGEAAQFVAELRETGRVIGACLLFHHDEPSARAEVGYVLGRVHWGAGLMQEAMRSLIGFAFGALGLRRLEAVIDPRNAASNRLIERLGFTPEGRQRERWYVKGEFCDAGLYGLLRAQWGQT